MQFITMLYIFTAVFGLCFGYWVRHHLYTKLKMVAATSAAKKRRPGRSLNRPDTPSVLPTSTTPVEPVPKVPARKPFYETRLIEPHRKETGKEALDHVLSLMKSSTKTLRVATFILSGERIIQQLILAAQRGVRVQIIVDNLEERVVADLRKFGVGVRVFKLTRAAQDRKDEKALFHQKYIIVDENVVMYGSCNLSESSFRHHYEDFLTTNDERFLEPFIQEFDSRCN